MTDSPFCTCQYLMGDVQRVKRVARRACAPGEPHGFKAYVVTSSGSATSWNAVPKCGKLVTHASDGRRLSYCDEHARRCLTEYTVDAAKQINAAARYATRLPGSAGSTW